MWRADRDSVQKGATDEDRAMAHENYGVRFADRDDARSALLRAIHDEIKYHVNRSVTQFNAYCVIRLAYILDQLLENPEMDSVESDGLRFRIVRWT